MCGGECLRFPLEWGRMGNKTLNGIDKDPRKGTVSLAAFNKQDLGRAGEAKIFGIHPNNHGNEMNKAKRI